MFKSTSKIRSEVFRESSGCGRGGVLVLLSYIRLISRGDNEDMLTMVRRTLGVVVRSVRICMLLVYGFSWWGYRKIDTLKSAETLCAFLPT